jgi:type IX secretion system PorP/SprF family membrane protein
MKTKLLILPVLVVLTKVAAVPGLAQSDFDFTQRWFNESLYNPAAVGNNLSTGTFLHSRTQWVGVDKAPKTVAASFDHYSARARSGFGLTLAADDIGISRTYNLRLAYAYYLHFHDKSMLSLGVSAGVLAKNIALGSAKMDDPNDPIAAVGDISEYAPDFDLGLEYKGPLKAGLTVRHIGLMHTINVWSYVSSRFNLNPSMSIEPMASFTWRPDIYGEKAGIYRAEGGLLFYLLKTKSDNTYNDRFWLGAAYRSSHNLALMLGMSITPHLRLGYSVDYGLGAVVGITGFGTHEIFLAYHLNRQFYKDVCVCHSHK